ncbi:MAG: hypothetical protein HEQ22_13055 [Sphingopyxis sp.]|uniref:hypothetical protein n=1 Tax=Sphingopyxis sp. TaxID=1908224 RepID=UPI003D811780
MDDAIQAGDRRVLMKRAPQPREVSDEQKQLFIDALAATCNVRRAAATAGFSYSGAYKMRRHEAGFAEAWQGALETGYARLEMALVERAILTVEALPEEDPAAPPVVGTMTVAQAMDVLNRHRATVERGRARQVRPRKGERPTAEETNAVFLARIAIMERQRGDFAPGGGGEDAVPGPGGA